MIGWIALLVAGVALFLGVCWIAGPVFFGGAFAFFGLLAMCFAIVGISNHMERKAADGR